MTSHFSSLAFQLFMNGKKRKRIIYEWNNELICTWKGNNNRALSMAPSPSSVLALYCLCHVAAKHHLLE